MNNFLASPTSIRLLVCSDVDIISAARLSEKFVPMPPQFDGVILIGPFVQNPLNTEEDRAVALGDMASIVAQFENIVCRVIYLPSESDPPNTLIEQMHLTPNSVGIHGRQLYLTKDLYISAFTEKGEELVEHQTNVRPMKDEDVDEYDIDSVEVTSGISISIIQQLLQGTTASEKNTPVTKDKDVGLFVLNYHFAHTLNHFLFHLNDELDAAGVDLCIITSTKDNSASRLPKKFGRLHIAVPQSLRVGGHYTVIDLAFVNNRWSTQQVESYQL